MIIEIDNNIQPPRCLDMPEIERRTSLKRSSIYALFKSGVLTPIKLFPKKTVVLERELNEFIEAKFVEARQNIEAN
ncbi:AlpA family phage regulatory protein [uncultured Parasphingorhabdus sp.]|uniref:AlpA family phage regulatory protein n=1 Tax=uncultured Parasphingorhabdus sp. TaxID=2709694 RepID=UPI0030D98F60|tara:strand:+ start:26110 stop:26337 length:228 start_codon:yes stop_codon:yes gene_type:complete